MIMLNFINYKLNNFTIINYFNYFKEKIHLTFKLTKIQNNSNTKKLENTEINANAELILEQYGTSILRFAYSYLHNIGDAEEILQETLIKYIKLNPQFENQSHEKAWLLTVTGNLSKNKLSYNKIRNTYELNELLIADDKKDLSFVWDAVKELPTKYIETIHLFYYEGYSSKQIAEILGKSHSTIRSNLKRGRDKLKIILKENYDFE